MILDKLENATQYNSISENLKKGFDFLLSQDLGALPIGKYAIDGDAVYAIVSEYETKEPEACKLEAHRKYMDIQYMVNGSEQIGVAWNENLPISEEYNPEKDVEFYTGESEPVRLQAGMFAVFFPNDLHRPGMKDGNADVIKKIVVKVKV